MVNNIYALYIDISKHALSVIREEDGVQHLVYYVSKPLHDDELRYSPIEMLVYALMIFARKLQPYFLEHPIEILTNYPLM